MKLSRKLALAILALVGCASGVMAAGPLQSGSYATIDQGWLYDLSGGRNRTYQSGVAAAGSGQSTATQLSGGVALIMIESGTGGFNLPTCKAGTGLWVYNKSGATLTAYPTVANNPVTGAQDTINGGLSVGSFLTATATFYGCPKDGAWFAK
jgi:hypothetical protein